jgi:hypothetical protein
MVVDAVSQSLVIIFTYDQFRSCRDATPTWKSVQFSENGKMIFFLVCALLKDNIFLRMLIFGMTGCTKNGISLYYA